MPQEKINRIMIAGTGSGCGKTTVTCAILQALRMQGHRITSFKCGPDYIDPMFHREVLGTPSHNIDFFLCKEEAVGYLFAKNSRGFELSLIEGVMGYYDGMGGNSYENSSYDISMKLGIPVILVISCKGASLSVAAMLKGYLELYPNLIQGVILNHVTKAMYPVYKEMLERLLSIKVLGFMPRIAEAELESRHLGLITAGELSDLKKKLDLLAQAAIDNLELDAIIKLAEGASTLEYEECSQFLRSREIIGASSEESINSDSEERINSGTETRNNSSSEERIISSLEVRINSSSEVRINSSSKVRIALARDKAFCFYYEDSLELLRMLGAELIEFSPLEDEALPPNIHGVFLGGGYPELYLKQLSTNSSMLQSIRRAHQQGIPIYGECGGYMYLGTSLQGYTMADIIPMNCTMTERLQNFGYVTMIAIKDNLLLEKGEAATAHEFHYSVSDNKEHALTMRKASGKTWFGGYYKGAVLGQYPHLHFWGNPEAAERLIRKCEEFRDGNQS